MKPTASAKRPPFRVALATAPIRGYRRFVSPLKRVLFGPMGGCRFCPTCSGYALRAFREHGLARGACLSLGRVLRCHPWHPGGFDPPPSPRSASKGHG